MGNIALVFLVLLLLIPCLTLGICYLIYRFTRRRKYSKFLNWLALIPLMILIYVIYTAIYPNEDFYENDFAKVTGEPFPANGDIIYKNATYPDQFGDYTSISIVKVDSSYLQQLKNKLIQKGYQENEEEMMTSEYLEDADEVSDKKIELELTAQKKLGVVYRIGFLSDKETIFIERSSF